MSEIVIQKGRADWYILLATVALMLFSVAFVYSASSYISELRFGSAEGLFSKHLIRIFFAIITLLIFANIDYHKLKKFSKPALIVSIVLLGYVLVSGSTYLGAKRWINVGFISFQPSELAKFCLVIHFAAMLSVKQKVIHSFEQGFAPFALWTGIILVLIALQPNFSTMTVIAAIAFSMMFIGNVRAKHLAGAAGVVIISFLSYMVSAEYRRNRLLSYFGLQDENANIENVSYQLNQALVAIGNGGLFGVGAGQSRQSAQFLPESYGDFIFSIIGEEFGFFGLALIVGAFALIFYRGMRIAQKAPDSFGYYLAVGILVTFAFYVFVNAGVNTGLLPTTGVPLPFISYGGTAVLIYAAAMGILLNISKQANINPIKTENPPDLELEDNN